MQLHLTPDVREWIQRQMDLGRYSSPDEVIQDALRALEEMRSWQDDLLSGAREKIAAGLASLDRGEGIPAEEVFAELAEPRQALSERPNSG